MRFLINWLVSSTGFLAAILVIPGITTTSDGRYDNLIIAAVAGLVNSIFGPIFKFFTFPFIFLTLGMWLLVANMIMFWFAGYLGRDFGFGFTVSGFWATFFGALMVSFISSLFEWFLLKNRNNRHKLNH